MITGETRKMNDSPYGWFRNLCFMTTLAPQNSQEDKERFIRLKHHAVESSWSTKFWARKAVLEDTFFLETLTALKWVIEAALAITSMVWSSYLLSLRSTVWNPIPSFGWTNSITVANSRRTTMTMEIKLQLTNEENASCREWQKEWQESAKQETRHRILCLQWCLRRGCCNSGILIVCVEGGWWSESTTMVRRLSERKRSLRNTDWKKIQSFTDKKCSRKMREACVLMFFLSNECLEDVLSLHSFRERLDSILLRRGESVTLSPQVSLLLPENWGNILLLFCREEDDQEVWSWGTSLTTTVRWRRCVLCYERKGEHIETASPTSGLPARHDRPSMHSTYASVMPTHQEQRRRIFISPLLWVQHSASHAIKGPFFSLPVKQMR